MALTDQDLDNIDKRIDKRLNTFKEEFLDEIDNKLQNLKSDFFERIDPVLKEVTTAREERPLIENRLEALEGIHQDAPHSLSK